MYAATQPYKCPVPHCGDSFSTLRRLALHLDSSVRRNRCGAYMGPVNFPCVCGDACTSITTIKVHASLHSRTFSYTFDVPADTGSSNTVNEGQYNAFNEFAGDISDESLPEHDNHEGTVVPSDCPEYHQHAAGDVMFLDLEATVVDDEEVEDDDMDWDHDGIIDEDDIPMPSLYRTLNSSWWYNNVTDDETRDKIQLYRYCRDTNTTVTGYRHLRGLHALRDSNYPLNLKDLRAQVERTIEREFLWPPDRVASISAADTTYTVPFLSVADCLSIWLSIPCILEAVRQQRVDHLPFDLLDTSEYDRILQCRALEMQFGTYLYESVSNGSWYIENLRDATALFHEEYLRAMDDGIEVLVCHLGFYEDDFSKSLNSLVSQTIFSLTLVEATVGSAGLTGLASLVVMLTDSSATKAGGGDAFRRWFVDELKRFQRGVRMTINGEECLIICLTLLLMGDSPALKVMCGLSPSISSTCYVRRPCMICDIEVEHLGESIINSSLRGSTRNLTLVHDYFRTNGGITGAPMSAWLREMMKQYGFLRISEFVRLHNQPSSVAMGLDTMHAVLRGALIRHFVKVVKTLTTATEGGVLDALGAWRAISSEFREYCRKNKISAFWAFKDKKDFKMRMTAGSIREFARVSCYILYKVGLVPNRPDSRNTSLRVSWEKRIECYNYWSLHVKIASMIDQHCISAQEVATLDVFIGKLLLYFHKQFSSKFITINVHYYSHFVDKIKWLGPMRIVANRSREHLIQILKPHYKNSNHKQKEVSVFRRYKIGLFYTVSDILFAGDRMKYDIDCVPISVISFDFTRYNLIFVESASCFGAFTRMNQVDIPNFMYDNSKRVKYKISYTCLGVGDYIYVSGGHYLTIPHVGKLVSVLTLANNNDYYIAYSVPEVQSDSEVPYLFYQQWKVKQSVISSTIYVAPMSYFICKLYCYMFDATHDAVIPRL